MSGDEDTCSFGLAPSQIDGRAPERLKEVTESRPASRRHTGGRDGALIAVQAHLKRPGARRPPPVHDPPVSGALGRMAGVNGS